MKEKSQGLENLYPMSFHQFCNWRIKQVENDTNRKLLEESAINYPNENKFTVLMPDALINSYDISPITYDVIIIDEGQDFKDEYWLAIEELRDRNNDAKLYIFQDGNQAIYASTDELPINSEPLFLFDNCRNTKPIHELAYQYYQGEEIEAPKIDGEPTQYIVKDSFEQQAFEIDKKVAELIHKEDIKLKDIAVIVMDNFNTAQELLEKTKNNKIWAFKEFSPQSKVLVETAKRFKGLESKIIFLWIVGDTDIKKIEV